ncbi:hypothetical protein CsSME_00023707 [Camellia sinensis var. sinensis]
MLEVPSRPKRAEDMEDVVKDKNHISQNGAANVGESKGSLIGGTTIITTKKSNPSRNGHIVLHPNNQVPAEFG